MFSCAWRTGDLTKSTVAKCLRAQPRRLQTLCRDGGWLYRVGGADAGRSCLNPMRAPSHSRGHSLSGCARHKLKAPYLEVTYRHGKRFAAYLYLPRRAGDRSARVREVRPGLLVVDFRRDGKPIGIEMTAPEKVSLAKLNRVLSELGLPAAQRADIAPLLAA
jgi:hypothetical protein